MFEKHFLLILSPGTPLKKPGKAIVGSPNGNRSISIKEYALEYDWTVDPKNILSSYQEITAQGKYHLKCGGVGVEVMLKIDF